MADGVHAPVYRDETAARQSMPDLMPTQSKLQQLTSSNHPVLAAGELGDPPVRPTVVSFCRPGRLKCTTFAHRAMVAVEMPRQGRQVLRIC